MVEKKLSEYESMKGKGLEITGYTAELADLCYKGKNIPNSIIINLIKENVEQNEKSLVLNYPTTYDECIEFTKVFGGAQPSEYASKSRLTQKIE